MKIIHCEFLRHFGKISDKESKMIELTIWLDRLSWESILILNNPREMWIGCCLWYHFRLKCKADTSSIQMKDFLKVICLDWSTLSRISWKVHIYFKCHLWMRRLTRLEWKNSSILSNLLLRFPKWPSEDTLWTPEVKWDDFHPYFLEVDLNAFA